MSAILRRIGALAPSTLVLIFCIPYASLAQPRDPSLGWHTLSTEHFTINFHEPLEPMARRVASVAERAHAGLSLIMGYEAQRRTNILLTDESEGANGSATALPRNTIHLFATAPSDLSPLGDYDDWLNMLVTHEHTHILHLDQWSGIASLINLIFGKVYAPNHILPRWVLEGIATWQESERTSGGRLRSTMFDMYLRMDALEGRLFRIDQMSNEADRWPHGNVWYLYGSNFIEYLANRFGRESIAAFVTGYGGTLIPYGLNRAFRRVSGEGMVPLYDEFLADRRAHYRAQEREILSRGRVEGRRLTHHGEIARMPRFLLDGRIAYLRADGRSRSQIQAFSLQSPEEQTTLQRVRGEPGHSVHPDGQTLVFSRVDNYRDIYSFHDLFQSDLRAGSGLAGSSDLDGGAPTRLTWGMRAREPDVSPDGQRVAFVVNGAGTTHLRVAELSNIEATTRALVESHRYEQVFTPRWSPDGRSIAFSRWRRGGLRDVQVVNVETGEISEITRDRALDTGPCWAPDGRSLYFSSDRTGVANIYRFDFESGLTSQVTNVVSGAYQPAISASGEDLVYVGYTSFGFDLFHLDLSEVRERPALPYQDTRPPAVDDEEMWQGPLQDYQPLESLLPQSYMLNLGDDGFGPSLGISMFGEDLAHFHRLDLNMAVGLVRGNINGTLRYAYQRAALQLSLQVGRRIAYRGGLEIAGQQERWVEEATFGSLNLSYRLPQTFSSQSLNLAYQVSYLDQAESFRGELDPNTPPPHFPEQGLFTELRFSWGFSNLERYAYDISPSAGTSASVQVGLSHPIFGSRFSTVQLTWGIRHYLRMPWLSHHVLAMHLTGGISGGDLGRRGLFSLGGFGSATPLDGLLSNVIISGAALRGYPAFDRSGLQYHLAQLEYRLPIWRFNAGLLTLPVYLNRIHAAVFADGGDAFFGQLDFETFRVGVGGQLLLDFTLAYFLNFTLRVGYARGLMEGGVDQFYGHLGVPF